MSQYTIADKHRRRDELKDAAFEAEQELVGILKVAESRDEITIPMSGSIDRELLMGQSDSYRRSVKAALTGHIVDRAKVSEEIRDLAKRLIKRIVEFEKAKAALSSLDSST